MGRNKPQSDPPGLAILWLVVLLRSSYSEYVSNFILRIGFPFKIMEGEVVSRFSLRKADSDFMWPDADFLDNCK